MLPTGTRDNARELSVDEMCVEQNRLDQEEAADHGEPYTKARMTSVVFETCPSLGPPSCPSTPMLRLPMRIVVELKTLLDQPPGHGNWIDPITCEVRQTL